MNVGEDFNFTTRYEYAIEAISLVTNELALVSTILIFGLPGIAQIHLTVAYLSNDAQVRKI